MNEQHIGGIAVFRKKCVCGGELVEKKSIGDLYEPLEKKYVCDRCGKVFDEKHVIPILRKEPKDGSAK